MLFVSPLPFTVLLLIKLMLLSTQASSHQLFFSDSTRVWVNEQLHHMHSGEVSADTLIRLELERLTRKGYLNADVDSVRARDIYLSSGSPFFLKTIVIREPGKPDSVLAIDRIFDMDWLDLFFEDYTAALARDGFARASLTIDEIARDTKHFRVDLHVVLDRGDPVILNKIIYEGTRYLTTSYLQRAVGVSLPQPYSQETITEINQALLQSPFLLSSNYRGVVEYEDGWAVMYQIEENRARKIDIIAGYNPTVGSSASSFVGKGDLQLDNLLSVGSSARLQFTRLPDDQSRLALNFHQYLIGNTSFSAGFSAGFYQQDTTYNTRNLNIQGGYRVSTQLQLSLHAGFEVVQTDPDPMFSQTRSGRRITAGFGLDYHNTDRRISPTTGWIVQFTSASHARSVDGFGPDMPSSLLRYVSLNAELQIFAPLKNRIVIVPRFRISGLNQNVDLDEILLPVGGAFSFRGYREEQFRVNRALWQDTEIRFLLDNFSYVHFFGSSGLINLPDQLSQDRLSAENKWLLAGGFGISYLTPLGFLQFTYAVSSDSIISDGMIHFGIVNSF